MTAIKQFIIRNIYRVFIKPILFLMDPEKVHDMFVMIGSVLGKFWPARILSRFLFNYENKSLSQEICGIKFRNPIGLSAGFDKNGKLIRIMPEVGFGYMQIGSITNKAYEGNPKPRLYRLKKSKGIVVYFGLKNIGVREILKKLKKKKPGFHVSASIAKTNCKETNSTKAGAEDYIACLKTLEGSNYFDLYTINISCPNTFDGEPFTSPEKLRLLLEKIKSLKVTKPVFLKLPINEKWEDLKKILEIAVEFGVNGVIIGNLNKNHKDPSVQDEIPLNVKGGISGIPTKRLSNELIAKTYKAYGDKLVIVGVGGVFSAEDAYEKIKLGASLVQLITGMIFEGPQVVGEINRGLVKLLKRDGYSNISEAIGACK